MQPLRNQNLHRLVVALLIGCVMALGTWQYPNWAYRKHALEEHSYTDGSVGYFLVKKKRFSNLPGKESIETPLDHLLFIDELIHGRVQNSSYRVDPSTTGRSAPPTIGTVVTIHLFDELDQ